MSAVIIPLQSPRARPRRLLSNEERARRLRSVAYLILWRSGDGTPHTQWYRGRDAAANAGWRFVSARLEDPDAKCYEVRMQIIGEVEDP